MNSRTIRLTETAVLVAIILIMFNDSLPDGIRRAAAAEGMLPLHFPEEERGKIPDRMPEIERMLIALRRKLAEELAGSRERAEIAELQVYIAEHCTEKLTRKELAGRVYLSESHLSKIFRDATGKRMVDYIREIRMLKAMDLVMPYLELTRLYDPERIGRQYGLFASAVGAKIDPEKYGRETMISLS